MILFENYANRTENSYSNGFYTDLDPVFVPAYYKTEFWCTCSDALE